MRGLEFVREAQKRKGIVGVGGDAPAVIGAVIDLGDCLDLTTSNGIKMVQASYETLAAIARIAKTPLPENSMGSDFLVRKLDCAVVNNLHKIQEDAGVSPYQTVKGLFREGDPAYENSGFYEKTHIQIAVRDVDCIKGVFRVPPQHLI